jgi:predicted ATPase
MPDELAEPVFSFRSATGLIDLLEPLAQAGRTVEALALVDAAIEQTEQAWLTPELLRLKGELFLLQRGSVGVETADDLFRQAIDVARRQGALSWALRAATSLGRLLQDRDRHADAVAYLRPIYDSFTGGFATADLIAAKQVLDGSSDADRR